MDPTKWKNYGLVIPVSPDQWSVTKISQRTYFAGLFAQFVMARSVEVGEQKKTNIKSKRLRLLASLPLRRGSPGAEKTRKRIQFQPFLRITNSELQRLFMSLLSAPRVSDQATDCSTPPQNQKNVYRNLAEASCDCEPILTSIAYGSVEWLGTLTANGQWTHTWDL